MTDDRVRQAFRTGLRPFVEGAPTGPGFDDLTTAALGPVGPASKHAMLPLLAGTVAVVLLGVAAFAFLQPRDTASFDAASAAGVGEEFWEAVASGDFVRASSSIHPDSSMNYQGLSELTASRGTPLEVRVGRDVFGEADAPQLCYLLDGPNGEARGSLVFRQNGPNWAVYEVRTGTAACSLVSPSTTSTQPRTEFRMDGFNGFIQSRLPEAFDERPGESAVVAMVPTRSIAEVNAVIGTLDEVDATVTVPPDRVRELAEIWVRGTRQSALEGEWMAIGLVPVYSDSPVEEWLRRLRWVSGLHAEWVDHAQARTRVPPDWDQVAQLPFEYGDLWRGSVSTSRGLVIITESHESLLVGYDGSWRFGDPVPEPRRRWMSEAYRAAVGDLVVYVTSVTLVLDVESLTWAEAPRPPVERVLGSAVIDGELYLVGRGQLPALLVFDSEEMIWRSLEPVPAFINVGDVMTDGTHLYVAGVRQGSRNEIIGDRNPVVFRYEPGSGWAQLPSIPIDGQAPGLGWADSLGLVGWNYDHEAALFTGGTWQALPDHPSACESYPRAETIPGGMYGTLCWDEPLIFDSSAMEWTIIETPGGFIPSVGPAGSALYVLVPNLHTTLLLRYPLD